MKSLVKSILSLGILFLVLHVVHFQFLKPTVVFRAGVIDVVLACLIGVICLALRGVPSITWVPSALIIFFMGLSYVSLIPTMVDRSITVYVLMSLFEKGDEGIEVSLLYETLKSKRIIDKRFEELTALGIIQQNDGRAHLLPGGRLAAGIFYADMSVLGLRGEYNLVKHGTALEDLDYSGNERPRHRLEYRQR